MDFIDEQDDVRGLFQFIHDRFHALLKLTPVFGAGDQRGDVEGHNPLSKQNPADLFLDNAKREPLCNGAFPDTRLPHEDRVVLFPSAQHLADAFNFLRAADDGVKFPFFRHFGQVPAEIVQHRGFGFGVSLAAHGAAATAS